MQNTLVYPRDYLNRKNLVDRRKCFFVMPFNEACNSTYAHLSEALKKNNYTPVRVDFVPVSLSIMHNILEAITTANFIIVDISGGNPNVFYELGIAHVFKDARNVILIKDKDTKVPSDIIHIRYIEYARDNYMLLSEMILEVLNKMSYITDLDIALFGSGIINVNDDSDFIFSILESENTKEQLLIITKLLMGDTRGLDKNEIKDVYNATEKMLRTVTASNLNERTREIFFTLYAQVLANCPFDELISTTLKTLLSSNKILSNARMDIALKTTIALLFLDENKMHDIAVPWVIEYFSRSKSTHIDLNRYKMEAFLTNMSENRFDQYIISALANDDRHIREHMADICAEKRLYDAAPQLRIQLSKETNIYSAASIMEALGKVGNSKDIILIEEWISKNFNMINNPGGNMIFKHALSAIISLEQEKNHIHSKAFEENYGELFIH